MGREDRIKELEEELKNTKYNKRTQHSIGLLKAKIARLKQEAEHQGSKKGHAHGYAIKKSGDASVVLLGFPSVGKSTLLNALCGTDSPVGAYEFTTLDVIPGTIEINHAKVQILDVPGIVYGAASGRGRGREVLGVIRSADLILMVVDALNPGQRQALLDEVYGSGIRLDVEPPRVTIKRKPKGGIDVGSRVKLTKIDRETVKGVCREMRITNADLLIKEDLDVDRLIDAIEGNRAYISGITVVSKADLVSAERREQLKRDLHPDLFISASSGQGLEELKQLIYDRLGLVSIFLKEVGKEPDLKEPLVMRKGVTIGDVCRKLHREFIKKFRYARIWGPTAKFDAQIIRRLDKRLQDGDILEIHLD